MGADSRLKRLALGTASIFLLIVGVLLDVADMYLMAVIVSLLPVVFWVIGRVLQLGINCERSLPESCERGERVPVQLRIKNTSRFPKFFLRFSDHLPRFVHFDGMGSGDSSLILSLAGGNETIVTYYIRANMRGTHFVGPTKYISSDLIGLSNYTKVLPGTNSILVYPRVYPVNSQFISDGASVGWHDQENAHARGSGSDFQGVREYRVGDDLRRLNWKTIARTGNLAVTEYSLGYAKGLTIVLDIDVGVYTSSNSLRASAFNDSVELCASLAAFGLSQGSKVDLFTGDVRNPEGTVYRNSVDRGALMSFLAAIEPTSGASLEKGLENASAFGQTASTLIVITGRDRSFPDLQGLLIQMSKLRGGAKLIVFWLDIEEYDLGSRRSTSSGTVGSTSRLRTYASVAATNVVIGPQTGLREMFSRSII